MDDSHVTAEMLLKRLFIPRISLREAEEIGPILFSVQAGDAHYSIPQIDDLPIEEYEAVEVAIIQGNSFFKPSELGIEGFDDLWEDFDPPIAPFVPPEDVTALRQKLKEKFDE